MHETPEEQPESLIRGVINPRIVDLIHVDRAAGEVVLTMIEWRPWPAGAEHYDQLDEKLSNYFVYVIDGFLGRQYPQYAGMPARVQLDTVHEISEQVRSILEEASRVGEEHGIRVALRYVAAEEVATAAWEQPS
jgi:hypothetical protein